MAGIIARLIGPSDDGHFTGDLTTEFRTLPDWTAQAHRIMAAAFPGAKLDLAGESGTFVLELAANQELTTDGFKAQISELDPQVVLDAREGRTSFTIDVLLQHVATGFDAQIARQIPEVVEARVSDDPNHMGHVLVLMTAQRFSTQLSLRSIQDHLALPGLART